MCQWTKEYLQNLHPRKTNDTNMLLPRLQIIESRQAWSPDGRDLAFLSSREHSEARLWMPFTATSTRSVPLQQNILAHPLPTEFRVINA